MENKPSSKKIIPQVKYYGIFAINKKDPNFILGYVENSFSMGWSRYFVNAWPALTKHQAEKRAMSDVRYLTKDIKTDEEFIDFFKRTQSSLYKKGMTAEEARKAYLDKWTKAAFDGCLAKNVWREMNERGIYVPDGFDVKVFRLNSKKLPVIVDFRYRLAYQRGLVKKPEKWYYRNLPFYVRTKTLDPDLNFNELESGSAETGFIPDLPDPKAQYNGNMTWCYGKNCPRSKRKPAKGEKSVLTRSERKILNKQRKNRLAAEERSQVGAEQCRHG